MGLWHGVEYYEKEKIVGEEYYQQWSNVSTQFFFETLLLKYNIEMLYKMLKIVVNCYVNRTKRLGICCDVNIINRNCLSFYFISVSFLNYLYTHTNI